MNTSIIRLKKELNEIQEAHGSLNSYFWGDLHRAWREESISYPLMCCYTQPSGGNFSRIMVNVPLVIIIADKVYKGYEDLDDAESDTLQVARDVYNTINKSPRWRKILTVRNASITKFIDKGDDEITGHILSLTVDLKDNACYDNLPMFDYDFDGPTGGGGDCTNMVANFIADNLNPDSGDLVTFTDLSDNTPTHWSWRFGDGTTSTLQNPTHTYISGGVFDVTLLAGNIDGFGDVEIKQSYITVSSFSPMDLNPFVWYNTLGKSLGSQPALLDETGTYTAVGGVSFVDVNGESFADFSAAACYDADNAFATRINSGHTVVMVMQASSGVPATFEALLGAFNFVTGTEHQYGLFQTTTGKIRQYIKLGANTVIADTLTQGLGTNVKSVIVIRVSQSNGMTIRINGVNRLLDPSNDGDLSTIVLSNLDVNINLGWGCRNSNGVASNFSNGKHAGLIGYNYLLSDSEIEQIEDYYDV